VFLQENPSLLSPDQVATAAAARTLRKDQLSRFRPRPRNDWTQRCIVPERIVKRLAPRILSSNCLEYSGSQQGLHFQEHATRITQRKASRLVVQEDLLGGDLFSRLVAH
jgi:hypothetical protein